MSLIKKCVRNASLILVVVFLSLGAGPCDFTPEIQKMISVMEDAINELNENSTEWQMIMNRLIDDLETIDDVTASLIRVEVQNLLDRGIAVLGTEFRCNYDFIGNRMRDDLIRLRNAFFGERFGTIPVPPKVPYVCQTVPSIIDRIHIPGDLDVLEYFGYDFDLDCTTLFLEKADGIREDISFYMDLPTHYHMTVDLGPSGVELTSQDTKFILTCESEDLSVVRIQQGTTELVTFNPGIKSFIPPHTNGDCHYGTYLDVWCTVTLSLVNNATQVKSTIWMKAMETTGDSTTVEGEDPHIIYSAPPGKQITRFTGGTQDSIEYQDSDIDWDEFKMTTYGPANEIHIMGRGPYDAAHPCEAGSITEVVVYYNSIEIEIAPMN